MKIGIDMGHTLSGEGTGSSGCGYKEQNLTRELGKIVIEMLKKEGHTIYDCTVDKSSNNAQQLIDRVNKANKQPLDLFVSIHFNACVNDEKGNGYTTGTEVLLYSTSSKAKPYAERIVKKIANVGLKNRGVKAIIAGAGGAAHLPGIFAAVNTCPVIGVPIYSKALNGIDSLYSIVQMPSGIPVATVAINGAKNAAILATQIIGVSNEDVRNKLADFKAGLKDAVMEKDAKLQDVGYENY